jgi:arabinogalactan endo-1,4-beta-galactosidase
MNTSCTSESPITEPRQQEIVPAEIGSFAKGADVSWLTQMDSEGLTFNNKLKFPTLCEWPKYLIFNLSHITPPP